MIKLSKPTAEEINYYVGARSQLPFTYSEQGVTRQDGQRPGYVCDHNRIRLGSGGSLYKEAIEALGRWHQFELGWIRVCTNEVPINPGSTVCLLLHILPVWAIFCCRVVYIIDDDGPIKRFGFAYGTLPGHPEAGEERFTIEWHSKDDSVWYDILAFSRPGNFVVALGYPFGRAMQRRFANESKRVMSRLAKRI